MNIDLVYADSHFKEFLALLPKWLSGRANIWPAEECSPGDDLQSLNVAGCTVTQDFAEFVPHELYASPQRRLSLQNYQEKMSLPSRMTKILLPSKTLLHLGSNILSTSLS